MARALLLVPLVIVAACGLDTSSHDDFGAASGLDGDRSLEGDGGLNGAARPAGSAMSPGLRAAYIASVQQRAGAAYRFEPSGADRAAATNAAQGLRVALAGSIVNVRPDADDLTWSLELSWTGLGRGRRSARWRHPLLTPAWKQTVSPCAAPTAASSGISTDGWASSRASSWRSDRTATTTTRSSSSS